MRNIEVEILLNELNNTYSEGFENFKYCLDELKQFKNIININSMSFEHLLNEYSKDNEYCECLFCDIMDQVASNYGLKLNENFEYCLS